MKFDDMEAKNALPVIPPFEQMVAPYLSITEVSDFLNVKFSQFLKSNTIWLDPDL